MSHTWKDFENKRLKVFLKKSPRLHPRPTLNELIQEGEMTPEEIDEINEMLDDAYSDEDDYPFDEPLSYLEDPVLAYYDLDDEED